LTRNCCTRDNSSVYESGWSPTLLFAQGVEAATVQRILGHSSITVTPSTYVDVIEQVQHNALSRLDVLFEDDDQSSS
jgi:integrase